jgi:hypothetical protein
VVNWDKELREKLGRNDPCPCNSRRRFPELLHAHRQLRRLRPPPLLYRLQLIEQSEPRDRADFRVVE